MTVPTTIIELAMIATSNHSDGNEKKIALDELKEIKEYVDRILREEKL